MKGNAMRRAGLATTLLKRASLEGFIKHLDSLDAIKRVKPTEAYYRHQGVRPPSSDLEGYVGEQWHSIKDTLGKLKQVEPYNHRKHNPEMQALIDDDIKHGRFVRLETGTSREAANQILRRGPSNPVLGKATHLTGFDSIEGVDTPQFERFHKHRLDMEQSQPSWYRNLWYRKQDAGIFASHAGTDRTRDYAQRASRAGNPAAKLSFDIPASLAQAPKGKEQIVPRFNWEYTRNHKIEDI